MAKRLSLNDREAKDIKKARPLNALFAGTAAPEQEAVGEEKGEEKQKPKKKENKEKKEKKALGRQTYHMDPVIVEAIRIMDFETREGISTILNKILKAGIDDDVLEQAEKNLKKREEA